MNELTDTQLIRLAPRQEAAFEALVRRHAPGVHRLACHLVGAGSADDVVQEVFLSVHQQLKTFRGEAQFSTWLHRVALNACYGLLRKRQPEALEHVPEPHSLQDPVGESENLQLRERLAWAMRQLPQEQREAVALRELSGLDYAAIAEITGTELGTVKSRIARGRGALRALLTARGITAAG
ncbi:RNA polymerase sigma factor [Deinococcus sp.]|uniref:RNA polymerase sigma factor n=1 Tax=Deinococcus sp. TaxID=47478 RepID=UPI003C7C8E50